MDHHLDLRLRPDPEFGANLLLSALYGKFHKALSQLHRDDIGLSFPRVGSRNGLGDIMRLHGNGEALQTLQATAWLGGLHDHIDIGAIQTIPEAHRFRNVRRVQAKSNPERLRRRLMKRHNLDAAAAAARIPDIARETLSLPYVHLNSTSTGQPFRLFIAHGPVQDHPVPGHFNNYGLSQDATVPWFV